MAVSYETVGVEFPDEIKRRKTTQWVKHVICRCGKKAGELAFIFCSDEEILRMNNLYLQHNYYTDILTFDYSAESLVSGDLFISLDTVKSNAEIYGTDYGDELRRVMIHGVLHLCGFADKTDDEARQMHEKEDEALCDYGI
jgi:rRNA maturation RNase YbeY